MQHQGNRRPEPTRANDAFFTRECSLSTTTLNNVITRQYISEVRLRREDVPSFDRYPFALPSVYHLDVLQLHPQVTFFVGENGSGKSTLLEAIAVA